MWLLGIYFLCGDGVSFGVDELCWSDLVEFEVMMCGDCMGFFELF